MPYSKTIVCLANSRKYQGRCVAGLEWNGRSVGKWIRPVSGMDKGVLVYERFCSNSNGRDPRLLDLISIEFLVPQPHAFQSENHRIDPCKRWVHKGSVRWQQLLGALERPKGPLWTNRRSTKNGMNDIVSEGDALELQRSLLLVQPNDLTISVSMEQSSSGELKRRLRGAFCLDGFDYVFSVTDCRIEQEMTSYDSGQEKMYRKPILCLSLSEVMPSQGACFKLIAGVISTGM